MNRKGFGVHFTAERYSSYPLPPPSTGSVYQEAIKAASKETQALSKKNKRVKLLVLASLGIVQAFAVLVSSIFDLVDVLSLPWP